MPLGLGVSVRIPRITPAGVTRYRAASCEARVRTFLPTLASGRLPNAERDYKTIDENSKTWLLCEPSSLYWRILVSKKLHAVIRRNIELGPQTDGAARYLMDLWETGNMTEVVRRSLLRVAAQERAVAEKGGRILHEDGKGQITLLLSV